LRSAGKDDVGVVQEPVDGGCGQGLGHDGVESNWNWLRFLIAVRPFDLLVSVSGASA
jgi:hypothetical protein